MTTTIFIKQKNFILLPTIAWLGVFTILAFFLLLMISFSTPEFALIPYKSFINFKDKMLQIKPDFNNYIILLEDKFYRKALLNSLNLAFFSTILTFIFAYPMAYQIYNAAENNKKFLLILVVAPFWTSLLIRVYGWIIILKSNGLLNKILGLFNLGPVNLMNSSTAVVIGLSYTYLPFMILPIYTSLLKIKPNLIEAAADLGARPLAIFWKIIFPLSFPGVMVGLFLVFIPSLGEFIIPDLLGGAKVMTIGKLLWTEFFMNRDWPMAAAITILLILIVIIPIKLINYFLKYNQNI